MWESAGVLVFDASFPAKGCVDQNLKSRGTVDRCPIMVELQLRIWANPEVFLFLNNLEEYWAE